MSLQDFSKVHWWLDEEDKQNFGDYLGYVLCEAIFIQPVRKHCSYKVIGSVISDVNINLDLARPGVRHDETIALWCCGARTESRISEESRKRIVTYGVRGPLTRDVLGLPGDTPLGDPGLIAPIVYTPTIREEYRDKTVCVPHFLDSRSDPDLLHRTGADVIVHPGVARSERAVFDFIDAITSASFVLTGALHAAIVACAYDVPFGYLDTGFVDIPFKWRDFSALVGIGTSFCDCVSDAQAIYEQVNRRRLRKPPLLPMLAVAPFSVRLGMLMKAYHYDMQNLDRASIQYGEHLTAILGWHEYSLLGLDRNPPEAACDPVAPVEDPVPEPSLPPEDRNEPTKPEEEVPSMKDVTSPASEPDVSAPAIEEAEQALEQAAHQAEMQDPMREADPGTAEPAQPETSAAPVEGHVETEAPDSVAAPEDEAPAAEPGARGP